MVDFGRRQLGDLLLELALVRGLVDATAKSGVPSDLTYAGPRPGLLSRADLSLTVASYSENHVITSADNSRPCRLRVRGPLRRPLWLDQPADTEPTAVALWPTWVGGSRLPTWLELCDDHKVEVYASLPMRYYLFLEHAFRIRLPELSAPVVRFRSTDTRPNRNVVTFVTATARPDKKHFGMRGFLALAEHLMRRLDADWQFRIVTGVEDTSFENHRGIPVDVYKGIDAAECVDLFASSDVVVGNDTGLTHLAAVTVRPDGSSPHVVGLINRHSFLKWSTGLPTHHAVAMPFSQMMALADRDLYEGIDPIHWQDSSRISDIPPTLIAEFVGEVMAWW